MVMTYLQTYSDILVDGTEAFPNALVDRLQGLETVTLGRRGGTDEATRRFFEFPGPLHTAIISPRSSVVQVAEERTLRAVCRDRRRRIVEADLRFSWEIGQDTGSLDRDDREIVTFTAPEEPQLVEVKLTVQQGDVECVAEALVTVTQTLAPQVSDDRPARSGLPAYSFVRSPGETWRSRFDTENNVILFNSGHRDYVYAARQRTLKLRYISKLYNKELVLHNFPGMSASELLDRIVELSLYTEDHLK